MNPMFVGLPGADLIAEGIADVFAGRETVAGELVKIGSPRLSASGVEVAVTKGEALNADRRLYNLLGVTHGNGAHSQFNALIRQLVSFEQALEQKISLRRRRAT